MAQITINTSGLFPMPGGAQSTDVQGGGVDEVQSVNLTSAIDELNRATTYAYDALNRLTSVTLPDPDGPGGPLAAPVAHYQYDNASNLRFVINPLGKHDRVL